MATPAGEAMQQPACHSHSLIVLPPGTKIIPQKIYTDRTGIFEAQTPVVFPYPVSLSFAAARGYATDDAFHIRLETSPLNRLKFTLRLEWPGYRPWSSAIQGRERATVAKPIQLWLLVERIANAVKKFLHENREPTGDAWDVTNVGLDRLFLLELHQVSAGSWQPVIALQEQRSSHCLGEAGAAFADQQFIVCE